MGHFKEEDWYKDLSTALESFDGSWLEEVKNTKIKQLTHLHGVNSHPKMKDVRSRIGHKNGKKNVENGNLKKASDIYVKRVKENPEQYFEQLSNAGKKGGVKNRETGHIQSLAGIGGKAGVKKRKQNMDKYLSELSDAGKKGGAAVVNSEKFALRNTKVCPHCNKETNLGNYKRWHGDNCKKK